jgi:hypothetical protein
MHKSINLVAPGHLADGWEEGMSDVRIIGASIILRLLYMPLGNLAKRVGQFHTD